MQLTGKQIVDNQIVYNYDNDGVQQQGVDVRVIEVRSVSGHGYIPKTGKTQKCISAEIRPIEYQLGHYGWVLEPGYYEVTFAEGCKIPANAVLHYDPRSSLVRCGGRIFSGQFDGGFETTNMGAFMELTLPITIEKLSRIAQARVEETYPVDKENLYNGQWQHCKPGEQN